MDDDVRGFIVMPYSEQKSTIILLRTQMSLDAANNTVSSLNNVTIAKNCLSDSALVIVSQIR